MLKWLLIAMLSSLAACSNSSVQKRAAEAPVAGSTPAAEEFVQVVNGQFVLQGKPYRFVGANMWYGAYLGSPEDDVGDRSRLVHELDFLNAMGVRNLRILGASEQSPLRDAVSPAITNQGKVVREDLLVGLDFLLAEMAKRDMKAVVYLNNFWEWSGGMATYLSWVRDGEIVDPSDSSTPWPAFALYSSEFYREPRAIALFDDYVKTVTSRVNSVTGKAYRDDPTIMSWQLANEPRPGHRTQSKPYLDDYYAWVKHTTELIKSQAPEQLVSLGSEGYMGCLQEESCVVKSHAETGIDYMTFHLWLKNWGWFDAKKPDATFERALANANDYIAQHIAIAKQLEMPVVLEEFGLDRDLGEFDASSSTSYRDQYFQYVYDKIEESSKASGPLVGSNIWAWGGFGEAKHKDYIWRKGDASFVGDPPQEPQGLNSVFARDASTIKTMSDHADRLLSLP